MLTINFLVGIKKKIRFFNNFSLFCKLHIYKQISDNVCGTLYVLKIKIGDKD